MSILAAAAVAAYRQNLIHFDNPAHARFFHTSPEDLLDHLLAAHGFDLAEHGVFGPYGSFGFYRRGDPAGPLGRQMVRVSVQAHIVAGGLVADVILFSGFKPAKLAVVYLAAYIQTLLFVLFHCEPPVLLKW